MHAGDRQRRRDRPRRAVRRDRGIEARGVDTSRLVVSDSAHVIAPYNRTLDQVTERFLGKSKIGTTGRGIGPTYADKMARIGIRVQDLFDPDVLHAKVTGALNLKNQVLVKIYNRKGFDVDAVVDELASFAERLRPMVADTSLLLEQMLDRGETVVLEAGQATLLDVDHGTYPFVTSSNATAGGACTGSGIPPTRISRVIAVIKAYTTRVGEGPFPTELVDAKGERLRDVGAEFGTTTGRPRRCGWFDAVDRPVRDADQRRHRLRPHQTGRPHRTARGAGVRRVRGRRRAPRRTADRPGEVRSGRSDLRDVPGVDAGHLAPPARSTTCPQCPRLRRPRSRR